MRDRRFGSSRPYLARRSFAAALAAALVFSFGTRALADLLPPASYPSGGYLPGAKADQPTSDSWSRSAQFGQIAQLAAVHA